MRIRAVVVAAPIAVLVLLITAPLASAYCPGANYYARATSGCCANGTDMATQMPTSNYYVCCNSTSDEAAWLYNNNNINNALECGWFNGYWPYGNHGVFSSFTMYMTTGDGATGYTNGSAPAGVTLAFQVTNQNDCIMTNGGSVNAQIQAFYTVSNGVNMAQGEVTNNTGTYMGGGSGGEFSTGYWSSNNGASWNAWGYMGVCNDSPYWIVSHSAYTYTNGGT